MFEKGSIIQRRVKGLEGFFGAVHTGIYVGGGYVIHFAGESSGSKGSGEIEKITLEEFADGEEVTLREAPHSIEHGLSVVSRAYDYLTNRKLNGKYSLGSCNCQDFVYECFEGRRHCNI